MNWFHILGLFACTSLPLMAMADDSVSQPSLISAVQHTRFNDHAVDYHVTFDVLDLPGDGDEPVASITATGYLLQSIDAANRPVMFVFNGGPGASAVLQVEGLGPLLRQRNGKQQALVANPDSILDVVDLVFIDPPGTGFSNAPAKGLDRNRYWSDHADARAVEDMIRAWLKTHRRERSSLYIAGESYGGYRLALLSANIADLHPAGVLLISPLLDATSGDDSAGNDLRSIFDFPSLVVAAATHGRGTLAGQGVEQVFAEARKFAFGDYAHALMQGSALPSADRARVANRMAGLLGVQEAEIASTDLRPDVEALRQSLLADAGQQIGRLDSRITAPLPAPHGSEDGDRPSAANDPALGLGPGNKITSTLMADYLRGLFGSSLAGDYVSLDIDIALAWTFTPDDGGGTRPVGSAMRFNPTPYLARLAEANPDFHILALNGYYDLAVPALGPWYALHHSALAPERIDFRILPTGHAVFAEEALRPQLHTLLKDFLE